jgi:PAS domain S-box-containing protein
MGVPIIDYNSIKKDLQTYIEEKNVIGIENCFRQLDELFDNKHIERLINNEQLYRILAENSNDFIALHDIKGFFIYASPAIKSMLGYEPSEIIGRNPYDYFHPDDSAPIEKNHTQLLNNQIIPPIQFRFRHKKGHFVWLESTLKIIYNDKNEPINIVASNRDITERKLAESTLKESEEKIRKFSTAITQSPAAIVITDITGSIDYVNPQFTNITGYTIEEAIGKNPRILKSGKTKPEVYENLWATITSGNTWKGELLNKRKDGTLFWEMATIAPIKDEEGKITNYIAVKEDITIQKEAESATLITQKKLKEANATKDKFFSIIAHDLKNPFHIILGFSDLLLQNHKEYDLETRENVIKTIYDISLKTFNLLENLLAWSRSKTGSIPFNPKILDIKLIAYDCISLFSEAAEKKKIKLNLLSSEDYSIFADRDMIAAVLRNLINNAIKFTNKNGKVTLIITKKDDKFLQVNVKDTGIGIKPEKTNIIFSIDRDWTTPGTEDEAGTGLGLFLCKEFIEKNGGTIWIQSKEGVGSEFIFTVPISKE